MILEKIEIVDFNIKQIFFSVDPVISAGYALWSEVHFSGRAEVVC
jgi:hypothetical protein